MDINSQIEEYLHEKISSAISLSGGCIANAQKITCENGNVYFAKTLTKQTDAFLNEANGLKELNKANCIRIPQVQMAKPDFLLLEYIEPGNKAPHFFSHFGKALAQMHKVNAKEFGFYENNYIGASPQYNLTKGPQKTDWPTFYFEKRLLPQLQMAQKNGYATAKLSNGIFKIGNKIDEILGDGTEDPCLLHGDLWAGNFLCDKNGEAVLIDPAVYYGHREADLAMTKMFGGFTADFYNAYQQEYPLEKSWPYRENIYLLYHYLNHLNLFGTGYYQAALNLTYTYL